MVGQSRNDRVLQVQNLADYFRTSIDGVISRQGVDVDPHAAHYVVNLLTLFSRSEELFEDHGDSYGLRPLALMMADAAEARTVAERNYALQRIGDIALFISGFFADSLANKAVDVDYYIYMGGSAYGSLSEEVRRTVRGHAFANIYRELAEKFQVLVDVLNEVRDEARGESDRDLLRTYEIWLKTGSQRARKLLAYNGIVPLSDGRPKGRH
jgi:hypothetical protein